MLDIVKIINLGLAFLLELCMLAAFAFWGFHSGATTPIKLLLGLGAPLLVAILWGVFLAPRAAVALPRAVILGAKVVIFGLAGAALYTAGQPALGWVLAGVFLVNLILAVVWGQ